MGTLSFSATALATLLAPGEIWIIIHTLGQPSNKALLLKLGEGFSNRSITTQVCKMHMSKIVATAMLENLIFYWFFHTSVHTNHSHSFTKSHIFLCNLDLVVPVYSLGMLLES